MEFSPPPHAVAAKSPLAVLKPALLLLVQAYDDAIEFGQDIWQFALQLPFLHAEGVSDIVMRRLIAKGLAKHARETTRPKARKRSVEQLHHLKFCDQSCFALTQDGLTVARSLVCNNEAASERYWGASALADQASSVLPSFVSCDNGCRELRVQNAIVKRYWKRGENQELVLLAFQEQHWRRCIHDPLPPRDGINAKRRLRDTIASLNRHQLVPLLRFHGDHTGRGLSWEVVCATVNTPSTDRQHTTNRSPT